MNRHIARLALHWRLFIYGTLLVLLAWTIFSWRVTLASATLPWMTWVCSLVERTYSVAEFNIQQNKNELVFHLRLVSDGAVNLYGHHFPRLDVSATTLVAHYLQHLFVFGAVLLSSALFFQVNWLIFFPMLLITLLLSISVDIPLTLLGSIEGLILQNLAPDRLDASFLVKIERAMNNGGRMGLALGLSLLSLTLAKARNDKRDWLF